MMKILKRFHYQKVKELPTTLKRHTKRLVAMLQENALENTQVKDKRAETLQFNLQGLNQMDIFHYF
jgi:hypothetical protein